MNKSKLVVVFNALKDLERREFRKFLQSPFFNHRPDVIELYNFLEKTQKEGGAATEKAKAWDYIFPDAPYEDIRMRHCMSSLFKLIERYLVEKVKPISKTEQKICLAKAYQERNLQRHFDHTMQAANRMLEQLPKDQEYYYLKHLYELELHNQTGKSNRSTDVNLQSLGDAYDIQFLATKLKQSCLQLAHQAVFKVDYDGGLLPSVLTYVRDSSYLEIPAIAIYYYCYQALTKNSKEDFQKLKNQFLLHQHQFPKKEMADVLLLAINFCIKQVNTGNTTYVREAFELYRIGFENRLLIQNNSLSRYAFKNTVALGLRLEEFEWIGQFIENYQSFLDARYRKSYYTYNLARLSYYKKDFQKAMPLLVTVDSSDLLLTIDAKVLLLKMYYELQELDALDALLASFKTYLNRKKVMGYHRDNYLKIIELTRKLLYLNRNDKVAVQQLKKEVEEKNLVEKKWLLEQLEATV